MNKSNSDLITEKNIDINVKLANYINKHIENPNKLKEIVKYYASQDQFNTLRNIFQLSSDTSAKYLSVVFKHFYKVIEDNPKHCNVKEVLSLLSHITTIIRPANINSGSSELFIINYTQYLEKCLISKKKNAFYNFVKNFTQDTQLQLLYQEQLMFLLAKLFNTSLGESDIIRRDFEKNKVKEIESRKSKLKTDLWNKVKKQISESLFESSFEEFWQYLLKLTEYTFNKSHAVSYSYLTLITTAMKIFNTAVFYAESINIHIENTEKVADLINEAAYMSINFKEPQLLSCGYKAKSIDSKNVILPINSVKGIGTIAGKTLTNIAEKVTQFYYEILKTDLSEDEKVIQVVDKFCELALDKSSINKSVINLIIDIGFFSCINLSKEEAFDLIKSYKVINEYKCAMKFYKSLNGKKFNDYAYKPKRNETIVKERSNNKQPYVIVQSVDEPYKDIGDNHYKFNRIVVDGKIDYKTEINNLLDRYGFLPFSWQKYLQEFCGLTKLCNSDLEPIVVQEVQKRKTKTGKDFYSVTDQVSGRRFNYFPKSTFDKKVAQVDDVAKMLDKHAIYTCALSINDKGFINVKNMKYIGTLQALVSKYILK